MRAIRLGALLALAAAAAVVLAGGAAASPHGPHGSKVVGHVYVNDNTAPSTASPASTVTPTGA